MDTGSMPKGIVGDRLTGKDGRSVKNDPGTIMADKAAVTSQLNGRLIRVVNINDLKDYFNYRSSDTGHIVYTIRDGDRLDEHHVLIIQGKPVAAYSEKSPLYGAALIEALTGVAGTAEYYFIEEKTIRSVLDMYPQIATATERKPGTSAEENTDPSRPKAQAGVKTKDSASQKPMASENPAVRPKPRSAKDPSDSAMDEIEDLHAYSVEEGQHAHVLEPVKEPVPESSPVPAAMPAKKAPEDVASVEDEVSYMKNVEEEFESNIDSLLNRLKLTHLKTPHDKKKKLV